MQLTNVTRSPSDIWWQLSGANTQLLYTYYPVGSKAQVPSTSSVATSIVPVSQPGNSGDTLSGSGSHQVESSEPDEVVGMEIEDVARQQLTLLRSLQQVESSAHSEHELHMYKVQMLYQLSYYYMYMHIHHIHTCTCVICQICISTYNYNVHVQSCIMWAIL